jgi:serine/threonine protein kinase
MERNSNGSGSTDSKSKQKHPIFNHEYEILSSLGEGNTSKVYLCRSIKDPKKKIALKLLREEFLQRDSDSIKSVEQEIQILQGLTHSNIVSILGYGSDGYVKKPSGREIKNLVFILLEYIPGGLLFDLCQTCGGMGEDGGRFFLNQMLDVLSYMQSKNVVHRDLKLENILVDDQLNLKVADFGFATYKKINKLKSYRGTMTYMAPEIKEGKQYDGRQIDIFSTGVILFIIVQGIFPFKEAKKDEYFYNLILNGKLETYWKKVGGQSLSPDFKDLILKMFSYDGNKRPTIAELKAHPWVNKTFSVKMTRSTIMEKLNDKRSEKTAHMSKEDDKNYRGGDMKELIRQPSESQLELYKFNDLVDHDVEVMPGTIWEELNMFNEDLFEGKLKLDYNSDKQYMTIEMSDPETGALDFLVKAKFFALNNTEEDEPMRLRLRLTKKRGEL